MRSHRDKRVPELKTADQLASKRRHFTGVAYLMLRKERYFEALPRNGHRVALVRQILRLIKRPDGLFT